MNQHFEKLIHQGEISNGYGDKNLGESGTIENSHLNV